MSSMKLLLLGPPRLERENVPVVLERRKALALLAYLAVTNQPQSREALATLLWPDKDETQAHAYLRRALWTLKQALGVEHIAIGRERIGLASGSDPLSDLYWPAALRMVTRPTRFVPPACPRSPRRSRCIGLT
jgi:DNA-binding SARP family transcriptional activator